MADNKIPKQPRGRRSHLRDFKVDSAGNYVYKGNTYDVQDRETLNRALKLIWAITAVTSLSVIVQGSIPADGMLNTFYIILPFMLELLCCGLFVYSLIKLTRAGKPLREYIYKATVLKIPARLLALSVFAFASALAYAIWLILNDGQSDMLFSVIFIALGILNGGLSLTARWLFARQRFEKLARPVIPEDER